MATKNKVVSKPNKRWERIKKLFVNLKDGRVAVVGIQGTKAVEAHEGLTNAELGAIHEYGFGVPERSFLRSTFEKNDGFKKIYDKAVKRALGEKTNLDGELMLAGEEARTKVIKTIDAHIPPPLSEERIEQKKGETTPLIDTGQLRASIDTQVKNRKDVEGEVNDE